MKTQFRQWEYDEKTSKVLSYAQRAQIYAMTAMTLNSGDGERAVWNAVQQYISHIQEMIKVPTPGIDRRQKEYEWKSNHHVKTTWKQMT